MTATCLDASATKLVFCEGWLYQPGGWLAPRRRRFFQVAAADGASMAVLSGYANATLASRVVEEPLAGLTDVLPSATNDVG